MSVITTPPIGFPDDQEQSQWQSQTFLNDNTAYAQNQQKTFGPFNVANWKATQLGLVSTNGSILIQMVWSSDSAGLIVTGAKKLTWAGGLTANFTEINLGPYLTIFIQQTIVGGTIHTVAIGSNSDKPAFNPNDYRPIIDVQGQSVGAGVTTAAIDGLYVYGGPAWISIIRAVSAWKITLQGTDESNVAHLLRIWDTSTGTSQANTSELIVLPPMRIQVIITNPGGAAASFWIVIVPDLFH